LPSECPSLCSLRSSLSAWLVSQLYHTMSHVCTLRRLFPGLFFAQSERRQVKVSARSRREFGPAQFHERAPLAPAGEVATRFARSVAALASPARLERCAGARSQRPAHDPLMQRCKRPLEP